MDNRFAVDGFESGFPDRNGSLSIKPDIEILDLQ